jgi:rod shape-determining protein MreC
VRNFILFIRRFFNLILFLLLEVVCIVLIGRTNTLQGNDIMSSANIVLGSMYKQRADVAYYFGLKRMNDSLVSENVELRRQLAEYAGVDTLADSSATYAVIRRDSTTPVKYAAYYYRTARVINNTVGAVNNYITLNRGEKDGIKKDMALISAEGAVGRIVHTSRNFSTAISVLSKKQQVSARLKDGTIGYVSWEGRDANTLVMKNIPNQIKVYKGDTVYTTDYSFFPTDVMIGIVYKTAIIKSKNLQVLYLRPATNFRRLQYVYIVENKMAVERKQLEATATGEDNK